MRLPRDIEAILESELECDLWRKSKDEAIDLLGIPKRRRNNKSPVLYETATAIAFSGGASCPTLEHVVQQITTLRRTSLSVIGLGRWVKLYHPRPLEHVDMR